MFRQVSTAATLKLTNTPSTAQPEEIVEARRSLKNTKSITTELETIANDLYLAQKEESKLLTKLCDTLTSVNIVSNDDKFAIFLNNIGRVYANLDEVYQLYLINMKDQLLEPVHEFNKTEIKKCQKLKLQLKTKKNEYDLKKKDEDKLVKAQSTKKVNLQRVHSARNKAGEKLDELESIRTDFIDAVNNMETEKLALLKSLQQYNDSYAAKAKIQNQNVTMQTANYMHWVPPNINNSFGLDSDAEDINDNEEIMSKFGDWGKSTIILKQGWVKKRGGVRKAFRKRWLKLYTNMTLVYLTKDGADGVLKGYINLGKIIYFTKKAPKLIEIKTKSRIWTLQFETIQERDEWFEVFMETKGVSITETADEWHIDRGMPPPPIYDDDKDVDNKYDDDGNDNKEEVHNEKKMKEKEQENKYNVDDEKYDNDDSLVMDFSDLLIEMKFKINVDNIRLYEDHELKHEIFTCKLMKDEIVSGQYIDSKTILLAPKLYISALDVVKIENDEFRQELVDKIMANEILLDDIVQEMTETKSMTPSGYDMDDEKEDNDEEGTTDDEEDDYDDDDIVVPTKGGDDMIGHDEFVVEGGSDHEGDTDIIITGNITPM